MRFITNCCLAKDNRVLIDELNTEEIANAENSNIRTVQREAFSMEYRALLSPLLDDNKIMRSDGCLKYAEFLPYDVRYPIILPRNNHFTTQELGN